VIALPESGVPHVPDVNWLTFTNRIVVWKYSREQKLQLPEETILNEIGSAVRGQPILDIGVGAGRTTPYLKPLASRYIGVDYSSEMVSKCRALYPSEEFHVADARDLSRFNESTFGLVFFSFNGIDYVSHSDRLVVFHGIRRLLRPGGYFAFSTHNRRAELLPPWDLSRLCLNPLKRPLGFAQHLLTFPGGIVMHWRNRKREVRERDYEIRNDDSQMYSLMTYYIHIEDQIAQLRACGFSRIKVVGLDGRWINTPEYRECRDSWIYFVAAVPSECGAESSRNPSPIS
jgi:SAM-dependent methyltransferase